MDKLLFGISGVPMGKGDQKFDYEAGINYLKHIGLDAMELPFVRAVNVTDRNRERIISAKKKNDFYLSAHGSYFVNLNAEDDEKIDKSLERIIKGANALNSVGGTNIIFHPGYYLKSSKEEALEKIIYNLKRLPKGNVFYRLETTGKPSQFGDLKELVAICKEVETCKLCVDFSHLHARGAGALKTYDNFASILDYIGTNLSEQALYDMHIHLSGINYTAKGERNHMPFRQSDFNYKDCLKALVDFNVKGCIICESPILENDALLLKDYYNSL